MNENTPTLKDETLAFMRSMPIMSAAINGTPPISTILLFAIDDDFTMYFAALSTSFKAKALEKDSGFSFSIWEHDKMYVQASGNAQLLQDPEEIDAAVDKLATAAIGIENFWPPVLQIKGQDYRVYRLDLNWIRIRSLSDKTLVEKTSKFVEVPLK